MLRYEYSVLCTYLAIWPMGKRKREREKEKENRAYSVECVDILGIIAGELWWHMHSPCASYLLCGIGASFLHH